MSVMNRRVKFEFGKSGSGAEPIPSYIAFSIHNTEELESILGRPKQPTEDISNRKKPGGRRKRAGRPTHFGAVALAALLALTLLSSAPRSQAQLTARAKAVGQRMMCVCGCNEVLTACNHVGCTYSHAMLKEVDDRVARGDSDDLILQSFIQEYGLTVLVDPPKRGFTALVWIAPILAPFLALFLIWVLVRRWRGRALLFPAGGPPISADILDRARRESHRESDE
jgi:cytochrome c-type biogenesis protein CcmH